LHRIIKHSTRKHAATTSRYDYYHYSNTTLDVFNGHCGTTITNAINIMMKPLIAIITLISFGCASIQPYIQNDATVTTAVSVLTLSGLKYAVKDSSKRTVISDYIMVYAPALRTITGNPSAAELTTQINAFIPANIRSDYPELIALVIPAVTSTYQSAYAKYGGNTKELYRVLSDIAAGLENGAAPYATRK